jgi:lipoprotein-anchoring transpeptidase ErfK/SrfK
MRNWLFWFFAVGLIVYCVLIAPKFSEAEPTSSDEEIATAEIPSAVALAITPADSVTDPAAKEAEPVKEEDARAEQVFPPPDAEVEEPSRPPEAPAQTPLSASERLALLEDSLAGEVPGGALDQTPTELRRKSMEALGKALDQDNTAMEVSLCLTQAIDTGGLSAEEEKKAYGMLMTFLERGLFDPRDSEASFRTKVQTGDNLWLIAKRAREEGYPPVAEGLIRLVNGLPSDKIYVGQSLKIPTSPVRIRVDKGRYLLSVFVGEIMIRRFRVGLGRDNRTPEGEFVIATREIEPAWYMPGEGKVSFGDPRNVLGTRWLGFAPKDDMPNASQFGIHGTKDPDSIGKNMSEGCVRMRNEAIEELFDWIPDGTKVVITP